MVTKHVITIHIYKIELASDYGFYSKVVTRIAEKDEKFFFFINLEPSNATENEVSTPYTTKNSLC